jgi:hypothetical protein
MNDRENNIITRLSSAGDILQTPPEEIISIKIREKNVFNRDYKSLIERLVLFANVSVMPITDSFHGNAYLITLSNEKIILVEHETGLEILYITGSIASFIGLIPITLQLWRSVHKKNRNKVKNINDHYQLRDLTQTEVRYINLHGALIEEKQVDLFNSSILDKLKIDDFSTPNRLIIRMGNLIDDQNTRILIMEERLRILEDEVVKLKALKKPERKKKGKK